MALQHVLLYTFLCETVFDFALLHLAAENMSLQYFSLSTSTINLYRLQYILQFILQFKLEILNNLYSFSCIKNCFSECQK